MRGQTYALLAIVFIIIISVFSVLNIDLVEVNYLFWRGSSPLIFVILFSVLLGAILTTVVGSKKYLELKRMNKELLKRVNEFAHEHEEEELGLERDTSGELDEKEQLNE